MKESLTFALDIGTRSIIGIAGRKNGDIFEVLACESAQHPKRAMIDGQIEDIKQVAKIAGSVKAAIEKQLGEELKTVSVAAAGRALRTCKAEHTIKLSAGKAIGPQAVYELESGAINKAREALGEDDSGGSYYCVGHSIVRYYVDNYPFATIAGHMGNEAKVEIIATFLPTEVINSLKSCMDILETDIETLTLEPIAAMRAVIPQDIRLLNLALVDIGAGTSDIAISDEGTIAGYTMATIAGDEISEAIIRKYLVDFKTAESIKHSLEKHFSADGNPDEDIEFTDILGFSQSFPAKVIFDNIEDSVEALASVIAGKITDCNGKAPAAVFLVGGGSKTPGLCRHLAEKLKLPHNKVAKAGTNFSGRITNENSVVDGPEYATPLGIALTAADEDESELDVIQINGRRVRMYGAQSGNVMDALMIGGWRHSDLIGRSGKSLSFTVNGLKKTIRGGIYSNAEVWVNDKPAALTAPVKNGDSIKIKPAENGQDAKAVVSEYGEAGASIKVGLGGKWYKGGAYISVNGIEVPADRQIKDFDELAVFSLKTAGEFLSSLGFEGGNLSFTVNSEKQSTDYALNDGDMIDVTGADTEAVESFSLKSEFTVEKTDTGDKNISALSSESGISGGNVDENSNMTKNSQSFTAEIMPSVEEIKAGAESSRSKEGGNNFAKKSVRDSASALNQGSLHIDLNGKSVVLPPKSGGKYQLYDLLAFVDIDPKNPQGSLVVRINGEEASYTDYVSSGSSVELGWKK